MPKIFMNFDWSTLVNTIIDFEISTSVVSGYAICATANQVGTLLCEFYLCFVMLIGTYAPTIAVMPFHSTE